jgi:hypothetical protein
LQIISYEPLPLHGKHLDTKYLRYKKMHSDMISALQIYRSVEENMGFYLK